MKALPVTTTEAVRREGVITVTRKGIPFSITQTADGVFKAFVSICPHDWIVMHRPAVRDDCLICPLHAATFDTRSGAIANARGKRISGGLHEVKVDISGDQIRLYVDGAAWRYFFVAQLRLAARLALSLSRRRRRTRKTTGPRSGDCAKAFARICPLDPIPSHRPAAPNPGQQRGRL